MDARTGKQRRIMLCVAACAAVVCCAASAVAAGPRADAPSRERIDAAVRKGLDYLWSVRSEDGTWPSPYARQHAGGVEALVAYTAVRAGEPADRAELAATVEALTDVMPQTVYARAMRVILLSRLDGEEAGELLRKDAAWLARTQAASGGWGYGPGHPITRQRRAWIDNSNTQLALMALAAAERAGVAGSASRWQRAASLWLDAQNDDGGWGYTPPRSSLRLRASSYGSMTAAGLATTLLLSWHAGPELRAAARDALGRAADWLNVHPPLAHPGDAGRLTANPGWQWGEGSNWAAYWLFAMTRAADAAGLRTVGGRDWYTQLTKLLLTAQQPDGAWRGAGEADKPAVTSTCFALLALLGARRPVLLNRIVIPAPDGAEPPHWRDAAAVARWFRHTTGRDVTWQAIPADAPPAVLGEAPLLYLAPAPGAELPEELGASMKHFLRRGGTVIVAATEGDDTCLERTGGYFAELMDDYHAEPLTGEHPVFTVRHDIARRARPGGLAIGDRCRTRVFVLPPGVAAQWQAGASDETEPAFKLVANILRYATGGWTAPDKRASHLPAPAPPPTVREVTVARVRHAGDWKTNPLAVERLEQTLGRSLSISVREVAPGAPATVWWLTGSIGPDLTAEQRDRIRRYVAGGGTLLVDPVSGREAFFNAAEAELEAIFGDGALQRVPFTHPLVTGKFADGMGADASDVSYLPAAAATRRHGAAGPPELWGIERTGRLAVVLSRYGLAWPIEASGSLHGGPGYGCAGLAPADARPLAANVVLYALVHGNPSAAP
ncbi:MAG: DUF4159 domain-containing protein [Planctomycetota bacterium]